MASTLYYSLGGLAFLTILLGIGFATYYRRWSTVESKLMDEELDAATVSGEEIEKGDLVALDPPDLSEGSYLEKHFRLWRHYRKRRKLLGRGYVQWILIEDGWPTPKFVQPVAEGGGIPTVEHDGTKYLFPPSAAIPDEQTGLRTIVHKKGEADPVNLEVPNELAIRADVMSEYLTNDLVSEAPKDRFWEIGMDLTGEQLMWLMIILVVGGSIAYQWLGGGAPI
jgi:hypothetical protein